jgi:hypothetical protein
MWILFHNTLDIPIYQDHSPRRPVPPRGALEAFKCAGQPKAAPEMQRLAFGVLAGSTPAGPMRWPCSVLRGTEEGGPSRAVPGRLFRAPLGINGDPCASGVNHTSGAMPRHKDLSHQRWIGALPERDGA